MALVFNQTPSTLQLAQSPMAFSVIENSGLYSASQFQYNCALTYWTGSAAVSGTVDYVLTKYPNTSGVGIFDLSRVLNSALNQLAYQYTSSVLYYKTAFNYQYYSGSTFYSGSASQTLTSSIYKSLDGYALFPEPINQNAPSKSIFWPLMTDGPVSQSVLPSDIGSIGVYCGVTGAPQPTKVVYSGSNGQYGSVSVSSSTDSTGQITRVPFAPSQSAFPITVSDGQYYTVQAFSGSTALGSSINLAVVCPQYYDPVRILWKNRYGQFDYLDFFLRHDNTFNTTQKTYQPQLGTWDASSLSYDVNQTNIQRYIVNTAEVLDVNTNYLPDAWNQSLKQLLVTDEVYWMYDQPNNLVKPLTIKTNSVKFKTQINQKLVQYTISFDIGQTFKLII